MLSSDLYCKPAVLISLYHYSREISTVFITNKILSTTAASVLPLKSFLYLY